MSEEAAVPHPYWSLVAAAGAGYLLGGGFPPRRLIGLMLAAGGRIAMTAILQQLISSQANGASALSPAKETS